MSEIEEGARVHFGRGGMHDYLVLARYGEYAWIREEGSLQPETVQVKRLTRIEPAEPQAKYPVGSWVRQRSTGEQGIVGEILHPISYKVKWPDGGENQYGEDDLEAVRPLHFIADRM